MDVLSILEIRMHLHSIPIELSLTNKEDCESGAKRIIESVKPEWSVDSVQFEVFTVGITNKIFAASIGEEDKIIFRVFGKNTDKIIDREHELESWSLLSTEGLAAPLLAKFTNGIVCGYLPGKCLSVESVREPELARKVAQAMAHMHKIGSGSANEPSGFVKMRKFERSISNSFDNETKQQAFDGYFGKVDLGQQIDDLEVIVTALNSEIGFCHNDLLIYNILFDERTDKISFIDYEYADYNYIFFDVANHFCEYAGVDSVDYSKCPSSAQKKEWIRHYLITKDGSEPTEDNINTRLKEIPVFEAMSHLFWSVWAIVQAKNSTIDFDYMGYAILRHQKYVERLQKYKSLVRE